MSTETDIILDALRWTLKGARDDVPSQNLRQGCDPATLIQAAQSHRVLAHVAPWVENAGEFVDPAVRELYSRALLAHKMRGLKLAAELQRISKAFGAAHLKHLSLKGPPLSQMLYGDPVIRSSVDLDILVAPEDVVSAISTLEALGYRAAPAHLTSVVPAGDLHKIGDLNFVHSSGATHVELHVKLLPELHLGGVDFASMWQTRLGVSLGAVPCETLSTEIYFCFLCAHGTKHAWERLHWLFDFAMFYRRFHSDHNLLAMADRLEILPECRVALALCQDAFGLAIPTTADIKASSFQYRILRAIVRSLQNGVSAHRRDPAHSIFAYWAIMYGRRAFALLNYLIMLRYKTWVLKNRPYGQYHVWQLLDIPWFIGRQIRRVTSAAAT